MNGRYFSMFTGVGGFELGLARSNRNVECSSEEKDLGNSEGNKSISKEQQNDADKIYSRPIKITTNSGGTLFQNGQEPSNSITRDLESTERNIEAGQSLRQTSYGVLSEGDGIRDDSQSMELGEDSPNSQQFKCVGFSEIDKYANQLLANKWPNVRNYGDCTKINPSELPEFDMLCGGFPCQSFSIAGKRRGFQDTRGTMFFEVARILEVKRPKIVFLENVKGLLNHNKGETFSVIIQTLDELGYNVQWMVLNSKFFGVPQNRERVFIIGSLRDQPRPEILPFRYDNRENIKICGDKTEKANAINATYARNQSDGQYVIHNVYGGFGEGVRKQTENCPTIRTPRGGGHLPMIASTSKIRRLTPVECERLQGFPDNWTDGFSNVQRYKMMGNAVTVNVIKAIAEKLLNSDISQYEKANQCMNPNVYNT